MKRLLVLAFALLLLPFAAPAATVKVAEIHGAVSPASAAYFLRVLADAQKSGAELMVLKLDTPGGLDTAMREMIQGILASPVPVAVWVAPSGARAASAGTYLLYASHIAAMAPGTNLGAATPVAVGIGGEAGRPAPAKPADDKTGKTDKAGKADKGSSTPAAGSGTMEKKATHDAAAYLRSLAQLRGRNAAWAERAVREAESLSAKEALQQKVIDLVAADMPELLQQVHGRRITLAAGEKTLALTGATVVTIERNWQERVLAVVADPNIALILLMLGIYGILFELYSPGFGVPGVVGAICLLIALYALAMLPINAVGALLLLLGIALMAAEAFMPTFGVFGVGGIVAFVAGAVMLIDGEIPGLEISLALIVPLAAASALILAGIGFVAFSVRRRPAVSGMEAMAGSTVEALQDIAQEGWVLAAGERWKARSQRPLARGERARIVAVDGLTLIVEPQDKQGE